MNREDVIKLAQSWGINFHQAGWPELERFAARVAAAEREACAKWLEDVVDAPNWADAIRAREQD